MLPDRQPAGHAPGRGVQNRPGVHRQPRRPDRPLNPLVRSLVGVFPLGRLKVHPSHRHRHKVEMLLRQQRPFRRERRRIDGTADRRSVREHHPAGMVVRRVRRRVLGVMVGHVLRREPRPGHLRQRSRQPPLVRDPRTQQAQLLARRQRFRQRGPCPLLRRRREPLAPRPLRFHQRRRERLQGCRHPCHGRLFLTPVKQTPFLKLGQQHHHLMPRQLQRQQIRLRTLGQQARPQVQPPPVPAPRRRRHIHLQADRCRPGDPLARRDVPVSKPDLRRNRHVVRPQKVGMPQQKALGRNREPRGTRGRQRG